MLQGHSLKCSLGRRGHAHSLRQCRTRSAGCWAPGGAACRRRGLPGPGTQRKGEPPSYSALNRALARVCGKTWVVQLMPLVLLGSLNRLMLSCVDCLGCLPGCCPPCTQEGCSACPNLAAGHADLCGALPCRRARSSDDMSPGTQALLQAAGTSQPTPTSFGSRVASAPGAADSMLQPESQEPGGPHPCLTRAGSSSAAIEAPQQSSAAIRQGFSDLVRRRAGVEDMPQGMGTSGGGQRFPHAKLNEQGPTWPLCLRGSTCSWCCQLQGHCCLTARTSVQLRPLPVLLTGRQDAGEKPGRFIRVMSVDRHLQVKHLPAALPYLLCAWHCACHVSNLVSFHHTALQQLCN